MKLRFVIILYVLTMSVCLAQIPNAISYQGLIINPATGETAANGEHAVKFAFYDASTDGNLKWQTTTIQVTSFKGLFATIIPVPVGTTWDQSLFVELTVDGLVLPTRVQLTTVPYAFKALTADVALTMNASGLTGTIASSNLPAELQDLAAGTIAGSRIGPGINASNIDNGTIPNSVLNEHLQDLSDGTLSASKVENLDASKVTTGTFDPERIPNLDVSKITGLTPGGTPATEIDATNITSGTLSPARLGAVPAANLSGTIANTNLDDDLVDLADGVLTGSKVGTGINATNITTGTLPTAQVPDLDASKIASGQFLTARMPTGFVTGDGVANRLTYWSGTNTMAAATKLLWSNEHSSLIIGNALGYGGSLKIDHEVGHPSGSAIYITNNWSAAAQLKTGIDLTMQFNGSGDTKGINLSVDGTGTGNKYGVDSRAYSTSGSASSVTGLYGEVSGTGTGLHRGVYGRAAGTNGTVTSEGVRGEAAGSGNGDKVGVYGTASNTGGSGDLIAMRAEILGTTSTTQNRYGVKADVDGGATGTNRYGVYGRVINLSGASTNHYGVYGSGNGGSVNNYGVYGTATGIGAYAVYASGNLHVTGNITAAGTINDFAGPSDRKLKRDILSIPTSLGKLLLLKPSTYYFRKEEFPRINLEEKKQYGLIAQDVEKIFPELVAEKTMQEHLDENGNIVEREFSYKTLDYTSLIPILIKGMQEQQAMIDELTAKVKKLEAENQHPNSDKRFVKASLKEN